MNIPRPCLALVTNRTLFRDDAGLAGAVDGAVRGGVNLVIMREKDLPDADQLALAKRLRDVTKERALLFINDSVSVALASGADGVQLGEASRTVAAARAAAGSSPLLVGRSVHDEPGAVEAAAQGADLLVLGNVFETRTHPGRRGAGLDLLVRIAQACAIPVIGIGGIDAANAASVTNAGAAGVAAITAVLGAHDPQRAAEELAEAIGASQVAGGTA